MTLLELVRFVLHIGRGTFDYGRVWLWSALEDMTQAYIGF